MNRNNLSTLIVMTTLAVAPLAGCSDDAPAGDETGDTGTETGDPTAGDGDGDPTTGDGDGDPSTGDGDGDPTTGDGDGDPTTGDGDGDPTTTGDGDGDPTTTGDGDGDPTTTGDGDGDAEAVCGDGMVTGDEACDDGVNDGSYGGCNADCLSLAAYCGDGQVDDVEACDDQNDDNADGCLGDCSIPATCADILAYDANAADGEYVIEPKPDSPWTAVCDMTTEGGGWTGITVAHTCNGDLDSELVAVDSAEIAGIDDSCRPFTRDGTDAHTYYFDVAFPPGFEELYIGDDYLLKANAAEGALCEITPDVFVQTSWTLGQTGVHGDVSFGGASMTGPVVSFASADATVACGDCEVAFPEPNEPWTLEVSTVELRVGWGERGSEAEGWYPWWEGTIFVR